MKSFKLPLITVLAIFALAQSVSAQAHFLWFEPVDGQPRLYFGEYAEGLHEKTGGRLDTLEKPEAQTNPANEKPVAIAIERKEDHLAVKSKGLAALLAKDTSMKVKDLTKNKIGIVKPMYYARLSKDATEAASPEGLDIQPVSKDKVRVNLHGKPLSKAKLFVYAPNQWMQEFSTDAAGEVTITTPWPGLYVLEVVHLELVPGNYQGDAYEAVRHVSTLSLIR